VEPSSKNIEIAVMRADGMKMMTNDEVDAMIKVIEGEKEAGRGACLSVQALPQHLIMGASCPPEVARLEYLDSQFVYALDAESSFMLLITHGASH